MLRSSTPLVPVLIFPNPRIATMLSLTALNRKPTTTQGLSPACSRRYVRRACISLRDALTVYMCLCAGELQIPQETLYKKNVLLMRGRFRPFTLLHNDMLQGVCSAHGSIVIFHHFMEPSQLMPLI